MGIWEREFKHTEKVAVVAGGMDKRNQLSLFMKFLIGRKSSLSHNPSDKNFKKKVL